MRFCGNHYPQVFLCRWVPLDDYGLEKRPETDIVELDKVCELEEWWRDWIGGQEKDILIALGTNAEPTGRSDPVTPPGVPAALAPLTPPPQPIAQQSVGELEAPTSTEVVKDSQGVVWRTFSEPVVVYRCCPYTTSVSTKFCPSSSILRTG